MPERGDIVIVTPPGRSDDYIKRVIGLPGDTVAVRNGRLILNGKPVKAEVRPSALIPVDANVPCLAGVSGEPVQAEDGTAFCRVPVVRETLPNGVTYDTIDLDTESPGNNFAPTLVPPDHVFLMGDNRDRSADSRFSLGEQGLGGPVPWENLGGRAEFITFSLDGSSQWLNPISWFEALRGGRAGSSLRGQKE
jgi:signal peptidase I